MKKKSKQKNLDISYGQVQELQKQYEDKLLTDPEYSLDVDPTGSLKFNPVQKEFIRHYVNFKNINAAAELAHIDNDTAMAYFVDYNTQLEIRRINRALYHRQFSAKLLSIDDIGGYLSSLLTGENVPLADQLKTNEKLRVVELILRLNEMKKNGLENPGEMSATQLETEVKKLSVKTIQQMLLVQNSSADDKKKEDIVSALDDGNLSIEEKAYLSTLPLSDLLKLVEEINNGGSLS